MNVFRNLSIRVEFHGKLATNSWKTISERSTTDVSLLTQAELANIGQKCMYFRGRFFIPIFNMAQKIRTEEEVRELKDNEGDSTVFDAILDNSQRTTDTSSQRGRYTVFVFYFLSQSQFKLQKKQWETKASEHFGLDKQVGTHIKFIEK